MVTDDFEVGHCAQVKNLTGSISRYRGEKSISTGLLKLRFGDSVLEAMKCVYRSGNPGIPELYEIIF